MSRIDLRERKNDIIKLHQRETLPGRIQVLFLTMKCLETAGIPTHVVGVKQGRWLNVISMHTAARANSTKEARTIYYELLATARHATAEIEAEEKERIAENARIEHHRTSNEAWGMF
ncbi:MAG: hypothetical protein JJ979_02540 [Roseibium sp.]|nr:hypothetical protein [Roseibium sp.]